jgi:hypothetical protein
VTSPAETAVPRRGRNLAVWALVFGLYVASAGTRVVRLHGQGHYVTLAQWLLEGRLSSDAPVPGEDAVEHDGRHFVAFPPLPAVLLLPWQVLPGGANPVLFTAALGAWNLLLMASFLRRALSRLGITPWPGLVEWVSAGFAFGTAHWYGSAAGTVWHTSQVCGLTFLLLAAREAVGAGRTALCGLFLGLATMARTPLAFALPFFSPLVAAGPWRHRLRSAATLGAPLAACVGVLLAYNAARFGSWTDFGYGAMKVGGVLEPYFQQGLFSLRHLPRNLYHAVLNVPLPSVAFPFLRLDPMGNSFLALSPFLLGAFLRRPSGGWGWSAWAAVVVVLAVDLSYFSSGYAQFGYRYSLDAIPFLLLAAAAGFAGRPASWLRGLVIASVVLQFLGLLWILNWPRMWRQLAG